MTTTEQLREALRYAKGITWDTCHKIYILMDDEQVALMREYKYDPIFTPEDKTPEEMLDTLQEWYDDSCELRFIDTVSTNKADPNAGFTSIIPQCEDWEDEE